MRIGIDGTAIWGLKSGAPSGVITYTINIINNIIEIDDHHTYCIYCFSEIPKQLRTRNNSVYFRVFRAWNRKLWQETVLPTVAFTDRLDLMFFPSNSAPTFCPCISVATIHDLHPYVIPRAFNVVHSSEVYRNSWRSIINKAYWKRALKIASKKERVIAVSKATKRDIENIFHTPSEKIEVVYEGIDRRKFSFEDGCNDEVPFRTKYSLTTPYILCVGTHGYKNLEGTIKSFSLVKEKYHHPLKLVIAGNKHTVTEKIFLLVKDLKLENEIIFTGFFPNEDLKYLYHYAELFLFPSFYEGFGLPVLEAFMCGTPVVTSTTGALPEVGGEAALLVDPYNPADIASAMLRLLSNEELRVIKRKQGYQQVAKFSWEEAGRRTIEVFEKFQSDK